MNILLMPTLYFISPPPLSQCLTLRQFGLNSINNDEQPPIPRRGTWITHLNSLNIQTPRPQTLTIQQIATHI